MRIEPIARGASEPAPALFVAVGAGVGSIEPAKESHDDEKGAVMTKLIALVAAGVTAAAAGAVFLWQKTHRKPSRWTAAKESASAWSKAAAQGAGKAADKVVR